MNRYAQRDEVLRQMGFASYREYLASALWQEIRQRLMQACDICPCGEKATSIHHTTYKRRYLKGRGKIYKYLVPVCQTCHYSIEFDDRGNKLPLGGANARLEKLIVESEARGVHRTFNLPPKRRRRQRRRKSIASDL